MELGLAFVATLAWKVGSTCTFALNQATQDWDSFMCGMLAAKSPLAPLCERGGFLAGDGSQVCINLVGFDLDRGQQSSVPRPTVLGPEASHWLLGFIPRKFCVSSYKCRLFF